MPRGPQRGVPRPAHRHHGHHRDGQRRGQHAGPIDRQPLPAAHQSDHGEDQKADDAGGHQHPAGSAGQKARPISAEHRQYGGAGEDRGRLEGTTGLVGTGEQDPARQQQQRRDGRVRTPRTAGSAARSGVVADVSMLSAGPDSDNAPTAATSTMVASNRVS